MSACLLSAPAILFKQGLISCCHVGQLAKYTSLISIIHTEKSKPKSYTVDNVATPEIHGLPSSSYPGAPLSIHFLDRPWEFDTRDCADGFAQLGAWRGLVSWEGRGVGPCSNPRAPPCEELKKYMSQDPHESGPPPSSVRHTARHSPHGSHIPSRQQISEATAARAPHESTGDAEAAQVEAVPMFPPPLPDQHQQQQPPIVTGTLGPSRALEMQSILNPSQPDSPARSSRAQSTNTGVFPSVKDSLTVAILPPVTTMSPKIMKRPSHLSPSSEPLSGPTGREARRVLTPRSPGLRATSLSARSTSMASAVLAPSPSVSGVGRVYTAEPGLHAESEIPPLPSASSTGRFGSSYPPFSQSGRAESRRASGGRGAASTPASGAVPATQSESPSTSHSSYSQFSQASPVIRYGNATMPPSMYPQPQSGRPIDHPSHGLPPSAMGEAQYDVGHGSYQMTFDTESGPMVVPVEVDVQQASKMADEKRKRNAGASARFRARRKEKEKEANQTIDSLQKVIRDVTEEKDFYLGERNFYRDFVARVLGPNQLPGRPPSPQARTLLPPPPTSGLVGEDPPSRWGRPSREGTESPTRSQRRRTGDYQPSFARGPAVSPMLQQQQSSGYGPSLGPPPPPPLQPAPFDSRPPNTMTQVLPPSRSLSYDPFRREAYDRSWNPAR